MSTLQPLAKLSFSPIPTPARDVGAKGDLRWIPLEQLYIDPTYQRAILEAGKANIRRMIEDFSWLQFGTLTVGTRPGGKFAIIDGQHRATAAMLHGAIKAVPCLVLSGGPKDEARAFSSINGNVTRIHVLQSFRAKVAAGDENAIGLVDLCASADVKIAPYPKMELDPGETLALGTIRQVMKRHGADGLQAALRLLRAADPESGLGAAAIMGTAWALSQKPDWRKTASKIGEQLFANGGARKLLDRTQQRKVTYGGTEWSNFSHVITAAIEMALRAGSVPMSRLMGGR